jgi:hypothetical protein
VDQRFHVTLAFFEHAEQLVGTGACVGLTTAYVLGACPLPSRAMTGWASRPSGRNPAWAMAVAFQAQALVAQPARATFKPKSALPQVRCSPVHRTRGEGCGERWCKCVEASAGAAWNTVLFP